MRNGQRRRENMVSTAEVGKVVCLAPTLASRVEVEVRRLLLRTYGKQPWHHRLTGRNLGE